MAKMVRLSSCSSCFQICGVWLINRCTCSPEWTVLVIKWFVNKHLFVSLFTNIETFSLGRWLVIKRCIQEVFCSWIGLSHSLHYFPRTTVSWRSLRARTSTLATGCARWWTSLLAKPTTPEQRPPYAFPAALDWHHLHPSFWRRWGVNGCFFTDCVAVVSSCFVTKSSCISKYYILFF